MKIIKIIGAIFLILILLIAAAVFVAVKTFDVQKLKAQIAQSATEALKREVKIDGLSFVFDIKQGFSLQVKDISIQDDKQFSDGYFMEVASVFANLDIQQFISQRKIVVTALEFKNPHIYLMRNEKGVLNLPQAAMSRKIFLPEYVFSVGVKTAEASDGEPINGFIENLVVRKVNLSDGKIVFVDKMNASPMEVTINDLDVNASNFSLDKSFPLEARASLFSAKQNISIKGNALIDIKTGSAAANNVNFETDLSQIDSALLVKSIPALAQLQLSQNLGGKISVNVVSLKVSKDGQVDIKADGQLNDGKIVTKYLKHPVDNIDVRFTVANGDLIINQVFFYLASGKVNGQAKVVDIFKRQTMSFSMAGEDINAYEVIDQSKLPVKVEGKVDFTAEGGIASLAAQNPQNLLQMQLNSAMTEGKILNVNVFKLVVNSLSMIPGFAESLETRLSAQEKEALNQKDTIINKLQVKGQAQSGVFNLDPISVDADGFGMQAKGTVTFDQMADMTAEYDFPQSISSSMVDAAPQLASLLTSDGRIRIPAAPYQGPVAKLSLAPDIKSLSRTVLEGYGRNELQKVINKALGVKEPDPSEVNPAQNEANTQAQQGNPESPQVDVIDHVFDAIFGPSK